MRANDSDPDGDPLSVESVTQPQHGTASIQPNGTVRYTPASGFEGSDGFTLHRERRARRHGERRGRDRRRDVHAHASPRPATAASRSTPAGIDCGTTCSADFVNGTTVTLVAHPDPGWTLRRLERGVQRNGHVHGHDGRGASPSAPTSCRRRRPPVRRPTWRSASGTVLFKAPELARTPFTSQGATQVPIGTEVDTTDGAAKVTVARGVTLDTSEFYDGEFTVLQPEPEGARRAAARRRQLPRLRVLVPRPGEEAPGAQALGQRQGALQDARPLLVGDRARDEVADRGPLRRHADHGRRGHGARPRLRPQRRRQRPGGHTATAPTRCRAASGTPAARSSARSSATSCEGLPGGT